MRGLAFIIAPDHVCTELIKLNGIDLKSHRLIIEEDLVNPKITELPSDNKTTAIKIYQTPIEEVPVVSGEKSKKVTQKCLQHHNFYRQYTKRYTNAKFCLPDKKLSSKNV